jgi:hypothetical protein
MKPSCTSTMEPLKRRAARAASQSQRGRIF